MKLINFYFLFVLFFFGCDDTRKQKRPEVYRDYHSNGQLFRSGTFNAAGKKEGKWLYYDEEGKLLQDEFYVNGEEDGTWNWYDDNGQIKRTEIWKDGNKIYPKE